MSEHGTPEETPLGADPWITRFSALVPPGGRVLDLACGGGRHTRLFRAHDHPVTAVDIHVGGVAELSSDPMTEVLEWDLEGQGWPLGDRRFAGVVVCNYLWRPLLPAIRDAVAPGGVLLYTTFAAGNERFGRPRNPDFLLRPGELLALLDERFEVRAYEHGERGDPPTACRQSVAAVRLE